MEMYTVSTRAVLAGADGAEETSASAAGVDCVESATGGEDAAGRWRSAGSAAASSRHLRSSNRLPQQQQSPLGQRGSAAVAAGGGGPQQQQEEEERGQAGGRLGTRSLTGCSAAQPAAPRPPAAVRPRDGAAVAAAAAAAAGGGGSSDSALRIESEVVGGVGDQWHHTFLTGASDIHQMEAKLFRLMHDFKAGNLRAFGRHVSIDQMECIREQQERLARQHFEVGSQQQLFPPLSDQALQQAATSFRQLMHQLHQLSDSIEKLHSTDTDDSASSQN